jgi:hypothetical protein
MQLHHLLFNSTQSLCDEEQVDVSGVGGKVGRGDESVARDDGVSLLLVCRARLLALERLGKC